MINFSEEQIKVLEKALKTYGIRKQSDILIEEMAELTKAIIKLRRYSTADCFDAVCEEIADVSIMLQQMIIQTFGVDYDRIVESKIDRLANRLEKDNKSKKSGDFKCL